MSASGMRWAHPVTLEGKRAVLVPLEENHADDLAEASADGALSKLWYTSVPAPNEMPASSRFMGRYPGGQRRGTEGGSGMRRHRIV